MTSPEGEKNAGYWDITATSEPTGFTFDDGGTHAAYASAEGLQQVLDMGVVASATSAINQIDGLLTA